MAEFIVELWHDGEFIDSRKCAIRKQMFEYMNDCKKRYKLNNRCWFDVKGYSPVKEPKYESDEGDLFWSHKEISEATGINHSTIQYRLYNSKSKNITRL